MAKLLMGVWIFFSVVGEGEGEAERRVSLFLAWAKMNENALSVFVICSVTISRWHSAITQGTPIWTQSLSSGILQFLVGRVGRKAKRQSSPHPTHPWLLPNVRRASGMHCNNIDNNHDGGLLRNRETTKKFPPPSS